MTEQANGHNSSSKVLLEKIDKHLDEMDARTGLDKINELQIPPYLSMTSEEWGKWNPDELSSAALILRQHSLRVRRVQNKHLAKAAFLERRLHLEVTKIADRFQGYGYQERKDKAIANSEHLIGSYEAIARERLKADNLEMLAMHIGQLAASFENLAISRRSMQV